MSRITKRLMFDDYLRQLENQLDFHNHKIAYHEKMAERIENELIDVSNDPEFAMDNAIDSMNFRSSRRSSFYPMTHRRYHRQRRPRRSRKYRPRYRPINEYSSESDDSFQYANHDNYKYYEKPRPRRYKNRQNREIRNDKNDPEWLNDIKKMDKSKSIREQQRGMFDIHDSPEFQGDDMKRLDERMKQARLTHEKSQRELEKERDEQEKENEELRKLGEYMLDGVSSNNSENVSEDDNSDTAITFSNVDRVIDDSDYDSQDEDLSSNNDENSDENNDNDNNNKVRLRNIPEKRDDNVDTEKRDDNVDTEKRDESSSSSQEDDSYDESTINDDESVKTKDLQNFDDNPDTELLSKYTQKVLRENKKNRENNKNVEPEKFVKEARDITIFDKRKPSENYKDMESLLKIAENEIDDNNPELKKSEKTEDKEKREKMIYDRADELFKEWKDEMQDN